MDNNNFLNDKFMPAPLPDIYAPRHQLLNIFRKAAHSKLIYVSAPAGFGKTVSTLLWLDRSGRKMVWIGLDVYDNVPFIFYKLFCTGILSAQPDNEKMWKILKSPNFMHSPIEQTIGLLAAFEPDDKSYALVLDDMHFINNKEIQKSLPFILRRLPNSFVKVILTRNEPSREYVELAESRRTVIITADNLKFTKDEIRNYFINFDISLTPNEANIAHAFTGGWAIGVNALAKSGSMKFGQSGSMLLEDYIKQYIWNNWDEDLKNFILKTAVLDEMPLELCEKITGHEDSHDILEKLCSTNSFVSNISEDTYRYHPLFLDFLRSMQENNQDLSDLYKSAAEYYSDKGDYAARHYAIKSGDYNTILQVSYQFFQLTNLPVDTYVNYLKAVNQDDLPESVCDRYPFMYISYVWINYLCGDASKMEYYLNKLHNYLPAIAQNFPQFLEMGMMVTLLDHRTVFSKNIEQVGFSSESSWLNAKDQSSYISIQMPFLHRSNRDYSEFADQTAMEKLKSILSQLNNTLFSILSIGIYCGLLYESNQLKEALGAALQIQNITNDETGEEFVFSAFIHLAAVYYAMGDDKQYDEVINKTETYIKKSEAYHLHPNFLAYKTKTMLLNGNKTAAKAWLDHYFVTETEQLEFYKIFQHFTTARAYMTLSQTDKAMRQILKLKKLADDYHRPLDIAEAGVLQAVLEWATGKKKEALIILETVLNDMQPYGFIRVIADEGAAVLPVLKKIISKVKRTDYQGELDIRYLNEVYLATYTESKYRKGLMMQINTKPVKLSGQQKLMLILLSQGYKNSEIIEKTGLALNTVKTHTRIAYAKLNVNNAADAVLRARELGIIE